MSSQLKKAISTLASKRKLPVLLFTVEDDYSVMKIVYFYTIKVCYFFPGVIQCFHGRINIWSLQLPYCY